MHVKQHDTDVSHVSDTLNLHTKLIGQLPVLQAQIQALQSSSPSPPSPPGRPPALARNCGQGESKPEAAHIPCLPP